MKSVFMHFLVSVALAFFLTKLQAGFGSTYITEFLKQNLITIQVALMAINSTTVGIVLTKIRDLIEKSGKADAFKTTKKEMVFGMNEQIVLIVVTLLFFLIQSSTWLSANPGWKDLVDTLTMSCFFYAILILYDNSKSVFVILDFDEK